MDKVVEFEGVTGQRAKKKKEGKERGALARQRSARRVKKEVKEKFTRRGEGEKKRTCAE